jgi:hypothetical protein
LLLAQLIQHLSLVHLLLFPLRSLFLFALQSLRLSLLR